MDKHRQQIIVTIIISVLVILYYVFYFGMLISAVPGLFLKLLLSIIPIFLGVAMIKVCIQRINEIEGGETDDLSQY